MEHSFINLVNLANKSDLLIRPPDKKIFTDVVKKYSITKYQGALFVAILPLDVLSRNPSWIRNGS